MTKDEAAYHFLRGGIEQIIRNMQIDLEAISKSTAMPLSHQSEVETLEHFKSALQSALDGAAVRAKEGE